MRKKKEDGRTLSNTTLEVLKDKNSCIEETVEDVFYSLKNNDEVVKLLKIPNYYSMSDLAKQVKPVLEDILNLTAEIYESNSLLDSLDLLIKFYRDPMHYLKIPLMVVGSIVGLLIIESTVIEMRTHSNVPLHKFGQKQTQFEFTI